MASMIWMPSDGHIRSSVSTDPVSQCCNCAVPRKPYLSSRVDDGIHMAGLVVLEGIDGCGKSTAAAEVARRIGERAILTTEPTDSWLGKAVRQGQGSELSPYIDALLFMADRAQHVDEMVRHIKQGKLVICDRYYHSTVAYQTVSLGRKGLGDSFDWLLDSNTRISIAPDVTFLFDLAPELALERISDRSEKSRFEKMEFLKEVRENYLRLAERDKSIVKIDATRKSEDIVSDILCKIDGMGI